MIAQLVDAVADIDRISQEMIINARWLLIMPPGARYGHLILSPGSSHDIARKCLSFSKLTRKI